MGCGASKQEQPTAAPAAATRVSVESKADAAGPKPAESPDETKNIGATPKEEATDEEKPDMGDAEAKPPAPASDGDAQPVSAAAPPQAPSARRGADDDDVVDFSRGDTDVPTVVADSGPGPAGGRPASGQRPASRDRYGDGAPTQTVARSFTDGEDRIPEIGDSKPAGGGGGGRLDDDAAADMSEMEAPSMEPSRLKSKQSDGFD